MKVSKRQVLACARKIKAQRPRVTKRELRALLGARFVDGKDPLAAAAPFSGLGAISNPWDWLKGLASILRGIARLFGDGEEGVNDTIDGIVVIVSEEGATAIQFGSQMHLASDLR